MSSLIRCGYGIGNRVATIANALTYYDEIKFVWRNNRHLPLDHAEVFPNGIEGVEFVDSREFVQASRFSGKWGHLWEAARDRDDANRQYAKIMGAMAGDAGEPCDVSIMLRLHRYPSAPMAEIARLAASQGGRVLIMADTGRGELFGHVLRCGAEPVMPDAPEMTDDMDRTPESLLRYMADWKRAVQSTTIITSRKPTSAAYPAMASGRKIIAVDTPAPPNMQLDATAPRTL